MELSLLECIDYNGRNVTLTSTTWEHIIGGHPEVRGYRNRICDVLSDPDYVYFRSRPLVESHLYFKKDILGGRFGDVFFNVIVRFSSEGYGEVKTAFPRRRVPNGDTLVFDAGR